MIAMDARGDGYAFRFRGGRVCLDFAATLGGRHRTHVERLGTPAELGAWFRLAMSLDNDLPVTAADLRSALVLREAIYRLVHPATRERPKAADIKTLNASSTRPDFAPMLGSDARAVTLCSPDTVEAGLATVARDAVDLLSGESLPRVRECAFPDCSLLFLDASHTGRRQWCDMKTCGNRYKVRQFRKAHAAR